MARWSLARARDLALALLARAAPPARWPRAVLPSADRDQPLSGVDYPSSTSEPGELPIYGFLGWRQHHVVRALEEIESGTMACPHQLMLAMLKDPEFRHGVETRVRGVINTDFAWQKAEQMPQHIFDEWCAMWPDAFDEDGLASATRQRICLGLAPGYGTWTYSDELDAWMLRRLTVHDTGNLTWFPVERRYKVVTLNRGQQTIEDDGDPWLLFREMASQYPHLHGACRTLGSWWWLKQEMNIYEALYGRVCTVPYKQVEGPAEQRATTDGRPDYEYLLKLAARLENNNVFPAPIIDEVRRFRLSLVEARGEAHKVCDVLTERCDRYFTLVLLGAIDNTQGGGAGSRARAEVHDKQTNKYLGADCKVTARTLSRVARKWCRLNGWPVAWAPIPRFADQPLADQKDQADAARSYGAAIQAYATAAGGTLPEGYDQRATAERCGVVFPRTPGEQVVGLALPTPSAS